MRKSLIGVVTVLGMAALMPLSGRVEAGTMVEVRAGEELGAVVERVRGVEKPVVIRLGAGRHELKAPLVLGKDDGGLTVEAMAGAVPVVTGSVRVGGWELADAGRWLWKAVVAGTKAGGPGVAPEWEPRQLYVDGVRMRRARLPDTGWLKTPGGFAVEEGRTMLPMPEGGAREEWIAEGGELVFTAKWVTLRSRPVRWLAGEKRLEIRAKDPMALLSENEHWFAWENIAEALDQPGEWRHDAATGVVWLQAPEGFDPDKSVATVPRLKSLVMIDGADGVVLRGVTFAEADYEWPWLGRYDAQAACDLRGLVQVRGSRGGVMEDCRVTNCGGYGVDLGAGAEGWVVRRCLIEECGAGGIRIGETGGGARCGGHRVEDCRVLRYGRIHPAGVGMIVFQSDGNVLVHNEIAEGFYSGFSVGWTWGYQDSPCHHNEIAWNHVHDIGYGVLSDMGGIYTLGPQPGTTVHHNYFHDITCRHYGGWGLYTDEGSTGIVMEKNVVARCQSAGFHQHYGRDNVIRNNLIVHCRDHALMRTREEMHSSFVFERNVVVAKSGTFLGSNWGNGRYVMRRNVWWDERGSGDEVVRFAGQGWAAWVAGGHDEGSVVADPLLVDPARPEKGLRRGSPAEALGWEALDLTAAGPRR